MSRSELRNVVTGVGCAKINVVFEQTDLHPLSFKQMHKTTSHLRRSFAESPSSAQVLFVPSASSLDDVVLGIKDACGADVTVTRLQDETSIPDLIATGKPQILTIPLAPPNTKKNSADTTIARTLEAVSKAVGSDWIAMLTGVESEMHILQKRATAAAASVLPYSKRPIFQKYVFFSPGLFMCIFAMLPLVIVALLGVRILMTIQTPTRFEVKRKEK
ncbi:hypothetical protein DFJ77DRAFT_447408 [Powellomyces hirtus]|nr:hypothetical protein DFJ77DRAFT_447408 [Powellomyces hirtus]